MAYKTERSQSISSQTTIASAIELGQITQSAHSDLSPRNSLSVSEVANGIELRTFENQVVDLEQGQENRTTQSSQEFLKKLGREAAETIIGFNMIVLPLYSVATVGVYRGVSKDYIDNPNRYLAIVGSGVLAGIAGAAMWGYAYCRR